MSPETIVRFSWIALGVILLALLAIGAVDLALVRFGPENGPTVSSTIWDLAKEYPVIVLVVGIILGHLFWPQVSR